MKTLLLIYCTLPDRTLCRRHQVQTPGNLWDGVVQSLVRITLHSLCTTSSQAFSVNASLIATTKNERTILRMNLASKKYFTA